MEILYQDKDIIVIIKPVGIDSEKQMVDMIKEYTTTNVYPIHRLDKNVSGVMVYALNKKSAADLSKCVQNKEMIKEYIAIVHGTTSLNGSLKDYLYKDSSKNKVYVVKKLRKNVKEASLTFETLKYHNNRSLVKIKLETGRTHQIRVQFASRGYPIVGDHKYGSKDEQTNPMLYCYQLTFKHHDQVMTFTNNPPFSQHF